MEKKICTDDHKMKIFEVIVIRKSYSSRTIKVKANSKKEATEKAIDEAGEYDFLESSSEYEVGHIKEIIVKEGNSK